MELQAHFKNIQKNIIDHLRKAENEILVAVAWFTDREIFEVLCHKAQHGVQVSVALLGDEINTAPRALNFHRLKNLGGKVYFLSSGIGGAPIMHHKFCVLDNTTVITGSYNWSKRAQSNDENITVVSDASEFVSQYRQAFYELVNVCPRNQAALEKTDDIMFRKRLEIVSNLILLGEQEDLTSHINKLRPAIERLQLQTLLLALEKGHYQNALELIADYLQRNTAVTVREDVEAIDLQFQLQILELRLESLTNEKSDLERQIVVFNRRYNDVLGELIADVLGMRAKLARKKARENKQNNKIQDEKIEQEAKQAEQDWYEYQQEYEEQLSQELPNQLSSEEEKKLKRLYRKACSLCHPDRFDTSQQSVANEAFVQLQKVYEMNDFEKLEEFYSVLKAGGLPKAPRSETLNKTNALRVAITELKHKINDVLHQLHLLNHSEGANLLHLAGCTEESWSVFFESQRWLLEQEVQQLKKSLTEYHAV